MRAYHEPERLSTPHSRAARKAPYSFATAASDRSEQPMREALRMRGSGSVLPVADLQANACSDVYQPIVLSPTPLTPPPSLRRRAPRRALSRMQRGEPSCAIVAAGRAARAKRCFMTPPRHTQRPFQRGAVSLGYRSVAWGAAGRPPTTLEPSRSPVNARIADPRAFHAQGDAACTAT